MDDHSVAIGGRVYTGVGLAMGEELELKRTITSAEGAVWHCRGARSGLAGASALRQPGRDHLLADQYSYDPMSIVPIGVRVW
jgi:hypothetical protein